MWIAIGLAAAVFLYGFLRRLIRRSPGFRRGTMYEVIRETAFVGFQRRRGLDPEYAACATLALHPLDNDHRPVEQHFEASIRKRSRSFAGDSNDASNEELRELTAATLTDYAHMAAEAGDAYYEALFERAAVGAQVELPEERHQDTPQPVSSMTFREYLQRYDPEGHQSRSDPL
jgi:hypothetical protein